MEMHNESWVISMLNITEAATALSGNITGLISLLCSAIDFEKQMKFMIK